MLGFLTGKRFLLRLAPALAAAAILASAAGAQTVVDTRHWSSSSKRPVATLDHPSLEMRVSDLMPDASREFRFIVYGDQRALADGEWQEMMRRIAIRVKADSSIRFLVDEGDIVQNGKHSDQFWMLRAVLETVPGIPYLVAVGNHELSSNRREVARSNTATFLQYLDPEFSPDRMWYRKDVGRARFLFLDSNDLVYGDRGDRKGDEAPPPGSRAERQLEWLVRELETRRAPDIATIVVMHHPLLQSSSKQRHQAASLWNYAYGGRTLPDILADGGVDLILSGHTHTYERFEMERTGGGKMMLVNISGRPRSSVMGFRAGARRARDLRGGEREHFEEHGWRGLERWRIRQEDPMLGDEANQFAIVTVGADGSLVLEPHFLDEDAPGGTRPGRAVWIR